MARQPYPLPSHSWQQSQRATLAGGKRRGVDDALSGTAEGRIQRSFERQIALLAMEHVFNRLAERRLQFVDGNLSNGRLRACLDAHMRVVIIARNRALRTDNDKTAFGLRLRRPGIGESPPARFEFRQAPGVAANDDRMLVDFQPLRLIDDRSRTSTTSSTAPPLHLQNTPVRGAPQYKK